MVKVNYTYEILFSEWNTCLRNLIILHPKRPRNIHQNQSSTHLSIAQKYVSVLKREEWFGFVCEALKGLEGQMTILADFGNLRISLK